MAAAVQQPLVTPAQKPLSAYKQVEETKHERE